MRSILIQFIDSTEGVTAVEYGLLVGLIAVVVIAALSAIGSNMSTMFSQIAVDL